MIKELNALYRAAEAADDAFRAALVKAYGSHNARTMRYMLTHSAYPEVERAAAAHHAASDAWLTAFRAAQRPTLPGTEGVRETENATPTFTAPEQTPSPFELSEQGVPRALFKTLFDEE
jgi:hypothetical protein